MINDKLNKAYLSIIREQVEQNDVCPECGNNPCTCNSEGSCEFSNFQELVECFSNNATKEGLVKLLNIALNDELLATYNYLASYNLSKTEGKSDFDPEFQAHEKEEYEHAHKLINRLREMNAEVLITPWCDIAKCNSAGSEWSQEMDSESTAILTRRYQEELAAIEFYSFILSYIKKIADGNDPAFDSTTHRLIKQIKADEEEHAKDLRDLLTEYGIEISEDLNPEASSHFNDDEDDEDDEPEPEADDEPKDPEDNEPEEEEED